MAPLVTCSVQPRHCSSVDRQSSLLGPHYRHSRQFISICVNTIKAGGHGATKVCTVLCLSDMPPYAANMPTRGRLRSLTSGDLDVVLSRLVTVGDRSYTTAAPRLCYSLPTTSDLPPLRQPFVENWKQVYFSNLILHYPTVTDVCQSRLPQWSLKFLT